MTKSLAQLADFWQPKSRDETRAKEQLLIQLSKLDKQTAKKDAPCDRSAPAQPETVAKTKVTKTAEPQKGIFNR